MSSGDYNPTHFAPEDFCFIHCWTCEKITDNYYCLGLKTIELIDDNGEKFDYLKGFCSKECLEAEEEE